MCVALPTFELGRRCRVCDAPLPDRWKGGGIPIYCSVKCQGLACRGRAPHNKGTGRRAPCLTCGRPCPRSGRVFCGRACFQRSGRPSCRRPGFRAYARRLDPPPPSPRQIAARCAEVRAEWSAVELLLRLRCDWRPLAWRVPRVRRFPLTTEPRR